MQVRPRGEAWNLRVCDPSGGWEAHALIALSLESALDDLDLNEFGVAALEKTFDNNTVAHPGSITIGTGLWGGRERGRAPRGPHLVWRHMAACPHSARPPGLSCRRQFAAELCPREHPRLLGQPRLLPLSIPVPSC